MEAETAEAVMTHSKKTYPDPPQGRAPPPSPPPGGVDTLFHGEGSGDGDRRFSPRFLSRILSRFLKELATETIFIFRQKILV